MRYLPIFRDISARPCLVVGGGSTALRKSNLLLRAGARVTVIAPKIDPALLRLAFDGKVTLVHRPFYSEDIAGRTLVIAATGDAAVNARVADAAKAAGIPVNVVDDRALSDVIMPAIVDRDPLIVAVSTQGAAPVLARRVRAAVEALLPADTGRLAAAAGALRDRVRRRIAAPEARRRFWSDFFRNWRAGSLLAGRALETAGADALIDDLANRAPRGSVAIVGAGPGDPDLLTLKALQFLQEADVVVHDRLVGPAILDYARRDAERIDVGKAPGRHGYSQAEINAVLAHQAGLGRRVVRLKGGDPFIFGRGGEELAYLRERGIAVEIVPGITAVLGCASEAGIPLTHRGTTQAVTLLTGTRGGALPDLDWEAHARTGATLAVYMGVGTADALRERLIAAGVAPGTPVAVIENGTLSNERIVTGRLDALGELVRQQDVRAPAMLIIGTVAAMADGADGTGAARLDLVS